MALAHTLRRGPRAGILNALGGSHGYVVPVVRHDMAAERDCPIDGRHRDVLRGDLRVGFAPSPTASRRILSLTIGFIDSLLRTRSRY